MKRWRGWLVALTVACLGSAQVHAWTSEGFIIDFNEKWLRDDAFNRATSQARKDMKPRTSSPQARAGVKTDILYTGPQTVLKNGVFLDERGVKKLAQMYPPDQRKASEAQFTKIIASFNENIERLHGVPANNVATGVVALLAGGYAAYHNRPFPEQAVKPTVAQVGDLLRAHPDLFEGKSSYKYEIYQVSVGIGMLLQVAQAELARNPDPATAAGMRKAGAQILQRVLGTEPDRVDFTSAGMVFR